MMMRYKYLEKKVMEEKKKKSNTEWAEEMKNTGDINDWLTKV